MDLLRVAKYVAKKMIQYQHLIGLLLTLIMLLLRFIPSHNEVLETRPANPPISIASNGSKVFDSWTGSLMLRDLVLENSEIAMVFYYAPWCARSIEAFREFEAAAAVLHKQVSFISVNCWWIRGECRGQFQFYRYPQIFLHHKNMRHAILYNGPLKKNYFVRFLTRVMIPMDYLSTMEDVETFFNVNQFTVLGGFLSSALESNTFKNYSVIATKHLENDLLPIQFGVVTDQKLLRLYDLKSNILQIRNKLRHREVIHLSLNASIQKVLQSLNKLRDYLVCPDLHFPGAKTNLLYRTVHKGPTMIVFVSSNTVDKREKYVKKIRQLVMMYHSCDGDEGHALSNEIYAKTLSTRNKCCRSVIFEDSETISLICSICVKQEERNKILYYAVCDFIESYVGYVDDNFSNWIDAIRGNFVENTDVTMCAEVQSTYDALSAHLELCCEAQDSFFEGQEKRTSENQHDIHDEILNLRENLNLSATKNGTKITEMPLFGNSALFTDNSLVLGNCGDNLINGLSCRTNRTLQFLTLDLDRHKALSENLGVHPHVYHVMDSRFGAVIFDPANERRHVMESTHFHLENFILNYTLDILPQNRRTSQNPDVCVPSSSRSCIHEVTTNTFDESVLNNDKDVVLLYYAPWCSACSSIAHTYLSLADLLHPTSTVYLARINAHTNDLPTPFTVQSYPTFIFFPAKRSSYSAVFPKDIEISVANLLSFIFDNASWESVKQILFNLCVYGSDYPIVQHEACKKWNSIRNAQ